MLAFHSFKHIIIIMCLLLHIVPLSQRPFWESSYYYYYISAIRL